MNWLTNFIRPKIRSIVEPKEVPDNLWQKCPSCEGMLFHRDLADAQQVCYHCGYHLKLAIKDRLVSMFDDGKYKEVALPRVAYDPLKFKDRKRYTDRLKESRAKTGRSDAVIVARGTMGGLPVVVFAIDFAFMGGSMGAAVGEGMIVAAETAVKDKAALIAIPASGGARMQEGMLSLMQMPRSIVGVEKVKQAGLPYIVLLTDPTTGGVSASFAMVGDIHIAEPGCMIGFAGKRVIQETIREELPADFQTAEYLLAHGMVDMVTPRKELRDTLIRMIDLMLRPGKIGGKGGKNSPPFGGGGGNVVTRGAPAAAVKGTGILAKKKAKPANSNARPQAAKKAPKKARA
ncbi:MAG: acetyl-CoA carboxylase, carboxyltransferase subunit beta [Alphaproteobacteria bacterium]|nr:acetyl-CoA carboxylase, carboxyltransferase subunit beta [Alphaproteobacteria bacterium]